MIKQLTLYTENCEEVVFEGKDIRRFDTGTFEKVLGLNSSINVVDGFTLVVLKGSGVLETHDSVAGNGAYRLRGRDITHISVSYDYGEEFTATVRWPEGNVDYTNTNQHYYETVGGVVIFYSEGNQYRDNYLHTMATSDLIILKNELERANA